MGMNTLLLLMMFSGGAMGPGLAPCIIQMRRDRFGKWKSFIMWIEVILVQGYFLWRGIPNVQVTNPNPPPGQITPPPGTTLDALMAQVQGGQQDAITQWFVRDVVKQTVVLILDLLTPSAMEESLMTQIMTHHGGGHPQHGVLTPNQVRAQGPHAQPVYTA